MLQPSFVEIGPLVPEKIFLRVFTFFFGPGGHLGRVTRLP